MSPCLECVMENVKNLTPGKKYWVIVFRPITKTDMAFEGETHIVTVKNDKGREEEFFYPSQLG